METKEVKISKITVRKRIREDLGDLMPLMESLEKYGQLNPVIIDEKFQLIAGERRLESAKSLGWQTINCLMIKEPGEIEKLEIELEENTSRKALTEGELAQAFDQLNKLQNPGFFRKLIKAIINFFKRLFKRK